MKKKIIIELEESVDMLEKASEIRKIKGIKQMSFKFKGVWRRMREESIKRKLDEAVADKKNIVIEICGGCLTEVYNIPDGHTYELIDWDNLEEEDEETWK